jgi:hypothetical protein
VAGQHCTRQDEPTLQQRSKLPRMPDIKLLEDRSRKPKHFEVLGKKGRRV